MPLGNARAIRDGAIPFAVGLLASVLLQIAGGWWLNSGRGVVTTMVALFAITLVVALWAPDTSLRRAVFLCVGSIVGMAATLFWIGPGTIWPIVLVVAAVMTAAAVFAGIWVAAAVRPRR